MMGRYLALALVAISVYAFLLDGHQSRQATLESKQVRTGHMATATFGAGCFWGVEAKFRRIPGVIEAISGYTGGTVENPSYEQVCGGKTGHTEAVQVEYDPDKVSYYELLSFFLQMPDPTETSKTQYKSVIFYHTPEQKAAAGISRDKLQREHRQPIATEILPAQTFYRAEEYHQRYYEKHGITGDICGH